MPTKENLTGLSGGVGLVFRRDIVVGLVFGSALLFTPVLVIVVVLAATGRWRCSGTKSWSVWSVLEI